MSFRNHNYQAITCLKSVECCRPCRTFFHDAIYHLKKDLQATGVVLVRMFHSQMPLLLSTLNLLLYTQFKKETN